MVDEELEGDWVAERDFDARPAALRRRRGGERARRRPSPTRTPNGDLSEFERFRRVNVQRPAPGGLQHRPGPRLPRRPDARAVPRPRRRSCATTRGGYARTTVHQNLVLRWVRDEAVYDVWQRLGELGLGDAGADEIDDVVSCPGTDSCKLGITSSMGLNAADPRAARRRWRSTDPLTRRIHIKMSGCPNGCSQHHIANIGFYGASIKVGEHTIPAYVAHIGGNYEGGEVVYGTRLKVRLPAKRVPGRRRALAAHVRGRARTTARRSTPSPTRVGTQALRGRGRATSRCRSSSASRP